MSEIATFGGGCFWGIQDIFSQTSGVEEAISGFMGGDLKDPTYEMVCTGTTGHAEAVQVTFDPSKVSYDQLLDIFWENHNPTTLNQDGPNIGSQYRSAIFYHTAEQKQLAEESRDSLEKKGKWKRPIVTEIAPATDFYKAEEYHQDYLKKNGMSSCHT